jgi:hypothetical protein
MGLEELRRIKEDRDKPKEKKVYRLNKVSPKTLERQAKQAEGVEIGKNLVSGGADLKRWFEDRRKELTGICAHCGGRSCKDSDQYWKFSIAHILPKAIFKSVATYPLNFIELCFFNNSCHTNFDNKTLDIMDLNCFDTVIQRFVAMYPSIDPKERRYIPDVLLQYVEVEK